MSGQTTPPLSEDYLTSDEEALLLRIARDSLTAWVTDRRTIDVDVYPLTRALRENHGAIGPPRYFDRRHWNQVTVDASIDARFLAELIDHSYDLVRATLPRRIRDDLPPRD